ncbi:MAG: polysaccharide biosynthesis/export family protein [Bacteroidales bacterium]|nr:polysaccharide biosynthesis/export family protein [Bacteroidales bacterium]
MRNVWKYILPLLMLLTTSCVTNRTTRLFQQGDFLPQYDSVPYVDYRLKKTDKIKVLVTSTNKEVTSLYSMGSSSGSGNSGMSCQIFEDGTVDIPFADSVYVLGMTLEEAEKAVEERLQHVAPDIYVKVTLANNQFYVMGRSGSGAFELPKERTNIYQALAIAGFSPGLGHIKHVRIIRPNDTGVPDVQTFDLRTETIVNSPYYYIYPNDIIYIEAARGYFFKIQSFSTFIGLISSSLSFMLLMLEYVIK